MQSMFSSPLLPHTFSRRQPASASSGKRRPARLAPKVNQTPPKWLPTAQDRLHVVYPKGRRAGRLKSVTHLALTEFPLILMQRDTSVRAIVGAGFHAAGLMPEATCEAIYMMTAVGMVRWAIMREERHEDSFHQR
jgi:hypothetical protein